MYHISCSSSRSCHKQVKMVSGPYAAHGPQFVHHWGYGWFSILSESDKHNPEQLWHVHDSSIAYKCW